jgi:hypothetical protein
LAAKPPPEVGTASLLPVAVILKATKQPKMIESVEWVANLMRANWERSPEPLAELRKQAKSKFGVPRRLFEEGDNCVLRQAERLTKNFNWRKGGRRPV